MNASDYFCYDCAFKHMSAAKVVWSEIRNGYMRTDHISNFIGNLAQAADHLIEKHPDLATLIRNKRKECWEALLVGDLPDVDFDSILDKIWEYATSIGDEADNG